MDAQVDAFLVAHCRIIQRCKGALGAATRPYCSFSLCVSLVGLARRPSLDPCVCGALGPALSGPERAVARGRLSPRLGGRVSAPPRRRLGAARKTLHCASSAQPLHLNISHPSPAAIPFPNIFPSPSPLCGSRGGRAKTGSAAERSALAPPGADAQRKPRIGTQ